MAVRFVLREGFLGIRRNPGLFFLAVSVNTITLFLLSLFLLLTLNLFRFTRSSEERVEVAAFLTDDAPVKELTTQVAQLVGVDAVRFVSKDDALKEFVTDLGEDTTVIGFLGQNPLPSSLRLHIEPRYRNPKGLAEIEAKLRLLAGIDDVYYGKEIISKLYRVITLSIIIDLILLIIVSATAIFVVFQTVRTTLWVRNREVEIMRVVGATEGTIKGPFIWEGFLGGLVGGVLSFGLVLLAYEIAGLEIGGLYFPVLPFLAFQVVLGVILGVVGSDLAAERFAR
jgi:cell division transport system permease protein